MREPCLTSPVFASRLPTSRPRRGITLMEVLISIFVASVGLLGLAALIPVGRFNVLEASKNDRANCVARAAFREIKARGLLRSDMWISVQNLVSGNYKVLGTPAVANSLQDWVNPNYVTGTNAYLMTPVELGNYVCLDPIGIGRAAISETLQPAHGDFPIKIDTDPANVSTQLPSAFQTQPRMTRASIRAFLPQAPLTNPTALAPASIPPVIGGGTTGYTASSMYAAADRIFRSGDDIVFAPDTDETKRPQPVWGSDNRLQTNGDYSWIVTIGPGDFVGQIPAGTNDVPKSYNVSVVVFYKRRVMLSTDTQIANRTDSPPSERYVYADFLSGGIGVGGSDMRLRLVNTSGSTSPEQSDFPLVKPNTWLMLSAFMNDYNPTLSTAAANRGISVAPVPRPIFQWYRILSVSSRADGQAGPELQLTATESGSPEWFYDVTLAGPDWDPTQINPTTSNFIFPDVDGKQVNFSLPTIYAALFENVVGVCTKTISADTWATP